MSKIRKSRRYGALLGLLLAGATALIQAADPAPAGQGSITLYFANQSPQCTFPVKSGPIAFPDEPQSDRGDCDRLPNGGYFLLREVPSATRLWLINGRPKSGQLPTLPKHCIPERDAAFNWWELRTIKQPTNTPEKIRIEDLKTKQDGDVLVPGLRLVGRYNSGLSPAEPEAINCLFIEVSP